MPRRIHISTLQTGQILLDAVQAHHVRDVLRLSVGTLIELFDNAGQIAEATITTADAEQVVLQVKRIREGSGSSGFRLSVASAIPKGDRADWMIEKLSEIGVYRFIPLATERSVVLPAGKNKAERWQRLAIESAKQSKRAGVMEIGELVPLKAAIASVETGLYLSTDFNSPAMIEHLHTSTPASLTLFVGPEGGWTNDEISAFEAARITGVKLTETILRIETAAVVSAGVVMSQPAVAMKK